MKVAPPWLVSTVNWLTTDLGVVGAIIGVCLVGTVYLFWRK